MYYESTCKSWRGRYIKTAHNPHQVTYSGHIVSVDQLVSPTAGLVEHMTVILATKKINYSTVVVDHFYIYSYMQLQNTTSSQDTLEIKHDFKRISASHGIIIKKYHADNGIFRANAWVQDC